jgi:CheY-like chemotaxis protein
MTINIVKNKGRPAEIMLIEDNRGDVVLIARAFRKAQIITQIRPATSAEQALAMLRKEGDYARAVTPDIILLDLNLPQMNGQEFLEIIKADEKLRHIPVVILSSSRADQDVVKSYNLHANGYIVKPTELPKFDEMVAALEQFFFKVVTLPDIDDIEKSA